MKIKLIFLSAITVVLFAIYGCNVDALTRGNSPAATEGAVKTTPTDAGEQNEPPQLCDVRVQSLDKQNLTDSVSYKIEKITYVGEYKTVVEKLNTENGAASTQLESGEYKIQAINGDFEKNFTIKEGDKNVVIRAENNSLYNTLSNAEGVCFIGDSITIGSMSGGYGWYDGLLEKFPNIKTVDVAAKGGQTSASIFDNQTDMDIIKNSNADTYIIALGINDVIYREKRDRATSFTSSEYIKNMERLVRTINEKDENKVNKFVFVAPFEYINRYSYVMTKYLRRDNTHEEYTIELYNWCKMNGYAFSAPMSYIKNKLGAVPNAGEYCVDDVHPAYPLGTQLYSQAVYESSSVADSGTLCINQTFFNEVSRNAADPNYSTFPTDYQQTNVDAGVLKETCFTLKNYKTGEYLVLSQNERTGRYEYKGIDKQPHYYYSAQPDGRLTVDNVPEGGYVINCEYNNLGYTPYLDTENVFVNGSDIVTNAYIYMKNKIE